MSADDGAAGAHSRPARATAASLPAVAAFELGVVASDPTVAALRHTVAAFELGVAASDPPLVAFLRIREAADHNAAVSLHIRDATDVDDVDFAAGGVVDRCNGVVDRCNGVVDRCNGAVERCKGAAERCNGVAERCGVAIGESGVEIGRIRRGKGGWPRGHGGHDGGVPRFNVNTVLRDVEVAELELEDLHFNVQVRDQN